MFLVMPLATYRMLFMSLFSLTSVPCSSLLCGNVLFVCVSDRIDHKVCISYRIDHNARCCFPSYNSSFDSMCEKIGWTFILREPSFLNRIICTLACEILNRQSLFSFNYSQVGIVIS